jgi:pimeloyl-ACP methyl ester carboxylesterase
VRYALAHLDALRRAGLAERDPVAYCRACFQVHTARQMGDPAALARMRSDPCRYPNEWPDQVAANLQQVMASLGDWDWRADGAALAAPTLIVRGSADGPVERARAWARVLPNARLLLLAGAGHLPWLDAPAAFFAAADQFLGGAWPAGAERVRLNAAP